MTGECVYLYVDDVVGGHLVECSECHIEFIIKHGDLCVSCPDCKTTLYYPEGASW